MNAVWLLPRPTPRTNDAFMGAIAPSAYEKMGLRWKPLHTWGVGAPRAKYVYRDEKATGYGPLRPAVRP